MSDDQQNQGNQSSSTPVAPNTPPQPANPPAQVPNTLMPSEDPFALDPRLVGEVQKGAGEPEQTAVVRPEIVRNKPFEEK
jgi:hypothetical protein